MQAAAALPVAADLTERDLDHAFGAGNDHVLSEVLGTWIDDGAADLQDQRVHRHARCRRDRDRANVEPISWGEIDDALDALGQDLNRLHLPLTAASHSPDLISRTDWRDAFRGLFDDLKTPEQAGPHLAVIHRCPVFPAVPRNPDYGMRRDARKPMGIRLADPELPPDPVPVADRQ